MWPLSFVYGLCGSTDVLYMRKCSAKVMSAEDSEARYFFQTRGTVNFPPQSGLAQKLLHESSSLRMYSLNKEDAPSLRDWAVCANAKVTRQCTLYMHRSTMSKAIGHVAMADSTETQGCNGKTIFGKRTMISPSQTDSADNGVPLRSGSPRH